LRVNEVEPEKRVLAVFDSAVKMNAAILAGIPLDRCFRVDDRELVRVLHDGDLVTGYDGDYGEQRTPGLPALRAPANMIVGRLRLHGQLHRTLRALADERSAREALRALLDAVVYGGMDRNRGWHTCPPIISKVGLEIEKGRNASPRSFYAPK